MYNNRGTRNGSRCPASAAPVTNENATVTNGDQRTSIHYDGHHGGLSP